MKLAFYSVGPPGIEPGLTEPKPVVTTITPWTKLLGVLVRRRCKSSNFFLFNKGFSKKVAYFLHFLSFEMTKHLL